MFSQAFELLRKFPHFFMLYRYSLVFILKTTLFFPPLLMAFYFQTGNIPGKIYLDPTRLLHRGMCAHTDTFTGGQICKSPSTAKFRNGVSHIFPSSNTHCLRASFISFRESDQLVHTEKRPAQICY